MNSLCFICSRFFRHIFVHDTFNCSASVQQSDPLCLVPVSDSALARHFLQQDMLKLMFRHRVLVLRRTAIKTYM